MLAIYLSVLETDEEKCQFEELYKKYKNKMYSIAYNILKDKVDTEDSVHETFLAIADNFKKISKFSVDELESYIIVVLRNTSFDIYKRNKKDSKYLTEFDVEEIPDIDVFEYIDYDRLIEVILNLPQIYKDVMFLHYLVGFSCKEIAKMLDISENNVCKRLERARKLLKADLLKE